MTKNTKAKAPRTAVISFREGVFYFFPEKIKEGKVRVFNGRNHFMGLAQVTEDGDILTEVENWLIAQRIVSA